MNNLPNQIQIVLIFVAAFTLASRFGWEVGYAVALLALAMRPLRAPPKE